MFSIMPGSQGGVRRIFLFWDGFLTLNKAGGVVVLFMNQVTLRRRIEKGDEAMDFQIWWLWMGLAALFVIGEIFTAGFFLLWFGVGAAAAGILALLGAGFPVQLGAFVVISGILFSVSRRFAERFSKNQPPGIGANRFIGLRGVVLEEIDNLNNRGRVRLQKEEWRADSAGENVIPAGSHVEVVRMDGTHLVVELIKGGE